MSFRWFYARFEQNSRWCFYWKVDYIVRLWIEIYFPSCAQYVCYYLTLYSNIYLIITCLFYTKSRPENTQNHKMTTQYRTYVWMSLFYCLSVVSKSVISKDWKYKILFELTKKNISVAYFIVWHDTIFQISLQNDWHVQKDFNISSLYAYVWYLLKQINVQKFPCSCCPHRRSALIPLKSEFINGIYQRNRTYFSSFMFPVPQRFVYFVYV